MPQNLSAIALIEQFLPFTMLVLGMVECGGSCLWECSLDPEPGTTGKPEAYGKSKSIGEV